MVVIRKKEIVVTLPSPLFGDVVKSSERVVTHTTIGGQLVAYVLAGGDLTITGDFTNVSRYQAQQLEKLLSTDPGRPVHLTWHDGEEYIGYIKSPGLEVATKSRGTMTPDSSDVELLFKGAQA